MDKSPDAFRTISEVAEDLDLPQHVLRFWETRFSPIRPLKRGGGRRYYRPDDVDLLKGIRHLLYGQGFTIKGVQRILKEDGQRFVQAIGRGEQSITAGHRAALTSDETDDGQGTPERVGPDGAVAWLERGDEPELRMDARTGQDTSGDDTVLPILQGQPLALGENDIERLRAALDELRECQRILGTLKAE
jgi:DNA-binding transcriptional MerR regulator